MADWTAPLPATAVEGADTHVEDHNQLIEAVREVRSNVDGIELTPGPKGDKGAKGDSGADGADGFPSEEDWNALVARVEALETPEA